MPQSAVLHRGSINRRCPVAQTSSLHRAHHLLQHGNDTQTPCRSTNTAPARKRANTYRKNSSFHSISPAALTLPPITGLVHFCCGGLSSSAMQRISPTPARETEGTGALVNKRQWFVTHTPLYSIQTHPKHPLAPISPPAHLPLCNSNVFTLTSLSLAAQVQHSKIPEQQLRTQRGCCYSGRGLSSQLIAGYLRNDESKTITFIIHSPADSSKRHHPCIY